MRIEVERRRPGCGCGGCFGCLGTTVSIALVPLFVLLPLGIIGVSQQGSDEAAIAAFNACPAVTEALGSPVTKQAWSMGCGESSSGGGSAHANWTISVNGPKGSASGSYVATKLGDGPWNVQSAVLKTSSGTSIIAAPCRAVDPPSEARPSPHPSPRPDREPKGGGGKKGKKR